MSKHSSAYLFSPRILRSHRSDCWGRELDTALEAYSDQWLSGLVRAGYDSIWVRLNLRETVASRLFPRVTWKPLDQLNRLVARAARHGVRVFVYLNEPKPIHAKDPFWKKHSDLKGLPGFVKRTTNCVMPRLHGLFYRLCTSHPVVQAFLEESAATLFRQAPGLGGAFLINASETFTHCYSHYYPKPEPARSALKVDWQFAAPSDILQKAEALVAEQLTVWQRGMTCPRCAKRLPVEVTAEVITLLARGIHTAAPRAPVIAWTWSWASVEPDPQPDLIRRLPKNVIIMSDWERGGQKKILGRTYCVDEYSFSSIGPSPRFKSQLRLARRSGLKVMAKIMVGATHEFAAVPYLPLFSILAEKMTRLRCYGVSGYLGCWNFGGDLNPMSCLAGRMSRTPALSPDQAMRWLARTEFGARRSARLIAAWKAFGRAWQEYPFAMPLLYQGPMGYATAFPFSLKRNKLPMPPNYLPLPRDRRGHILAGFNPQRWLHLGITGGNYQRFSARIPAPFDAAVAAEAFEKLLKTWRCGLTFYRDALRQNGDAGILAREYRLAQHIGLCLQSTVHIIRFHTLLNELSGKPDKPARKKTLCLLRQIAEAERANVIADRELIVQDIELGYHPEAHVRLFTEADLDYKRGQLDRIICALQDRSILDT